MNPTPFFIIVALVMAGSILSLVSTPWCIMALAMATIFGLDQIVSAIKERK